MALGERIHRVMEHRLFWVCLTLAALVIVLILELVSGGLQEWYVSTVETPGQFTVTTKLGLWNNCTDVAVQNRSAAAPYSACKVKNFDIFTCPEAKVYEAFNASMIFLVFSLICVVFTVAFLLFSLMEQRLGKSACRLNAKLSCGLSFAAMLFVLIAWSVFHGQLSLSHRCVLRTGAVSYRYLGPCSETGLTMADGTIRTCKYGSAWILAVTAWALLVPTTLLIYYKCLFQSYLGFRAEPERASTPVLRVKESDHFGPSDDQKPLLEPEVKTPAPLPTPVEMQPKVHEEIPPVPGDHARHPSEVPAIHEDQGPHHPQ
eukprot:NODE_816_length_1153_cov_181.729167_g660_i0.p1 GENE.NODE_816_length_1153_cov_181.729167_g660_i0~~NODE_816_length_1153_cov_181.729167_g660_i0.p1  ORF type:complete len:317 (-),score=34.89 NODE_816_length_1153_cov_181.729167_g660_i0:153-1103(-)